MQYMLTSIELLALLIIAVSFIISYIGFKDAAFYERYAFDADRIKEDREVLRVISSGFLHNGWTHLVFNTLFLFGMTHLTGLGLTAGNFIVVYFVSLIAACTYIVLYNKKSVEMMATSTAAVGGVVCAVVLTTPGMISIPFTSLYMPVWVVGVSYLVMASFSLSGKGKGVNHELVLMGALAGFITVLFSQPELVRSNPWVFAASGLLLPLLIVVAKKNAEWFAFNWRKDKDEEGVEFVLDDEGELNRLLEKVNRKGIESLSRKEKMKLEELSKKI